MVALSSLSAPVPAASAPDSSRAATWLPWILGGAFILCFALRDLLLTRGLIIDGLDVWGRDFVNIWTGGHLVRQGQLANLSNVSAYQAFQQQLFGPIGKHNYSYPPVTFPLAAMLSYLSYPLAL